MKRMMMAVVLAVAGIAAADSDVDTFKTVLEKVADAETQYRIGNCYAEGKGLVLPTRRRAPFSVPSSETQTVSQAF